MDLVDRLNIFIKSEGISPSVLADSCDIPRPTVSQLLNGRNKKISDDIIGRIHKVFPHLSVLWLMFGEGEMIEKNTNPENSPQAQPVLAQDNSQQSTPAGTDYRDITDFMNIVTKNSQDNSIDDNENSSTPLVTTENRKRITNIVVFYSDNSFQSFSPSK